MMFLYRRFLTFGLLLSIGIYVNGQPLAEGQSKFLGCAYSSAQSTNFARYWNQVTPENGGKWGTAEGSRDIMRWTEIDAAYQLAGSKGYPFKEHTLIWGNQQPTWIESLDSAAQMEEIEEWFSALATRYPEIDLIDVVNEPLHAPPSGAGHGNYMNALGGSGVTGWDWVIKSFRLARKYFPSAKLLINEYNIVNSLSSTQQYIGIINLLKADTLIDGIGVQAHAFSTSGVSADLIKSNLDLLAATGLPVYATELDIDGASDVIQLKEYMRVFPVFWNHPAVAGITLWGFRYGLWRNSQGAYLVTQTGVERPAFNWLKAYVNDTLTLSQSVIVSENDENDTIYIDETLQFSAQVMPENTTINNISWSLNPSNVGTISANGLFVPVRTGSVMIRAVTWDTGKIGSKTITIVTRPVENILVNAEGNNDTILLDEALQMNASVMPENATNNTVSWNLLQQGIASISETGLLTPITAGTVTVIATANDGSGVCDSMDITIIDPTGVDLAFGQHMSLYPNPAREGKFTIKGLSQGMQIKILDLSGRVIRDIPMSALNELVVGLEDYRGVCIVRISDGTRSVYRKIVME